MAVIIFYVAFHVLFSKGCDTNRSQIQELVRLCLVLEWLIELLELVVWE